MTTPEEVLAEDLSYETVCTPDEPAEYQRLGASAVRALRRAGFDVVLRTPDTLTDSEQCSWCNGYGNARGGPQPEGLIGWSPCSRCGGSGHPIDSDTAARLPSKCPTCGSENPDTYYGSCFDNIHSTIFDPRLPLDPWHAYMTDLRLLRRDVDNLNAYVKAGREVRERVEAERDAAVARADQLRAEAAAIMQARAEHHPFVDSTAWALIETLATAAVSPPPAPTACPTCGSDDPAVQRVRGPGQRHCPDEFHSGGK